MKASNQKSRSSKLGTLTPEQQQAVFAHCENATIAEAIRWLKAEFDIQIGSNALSRWLRSRREQQSVAASPRKIRPDSKLGVLKAAQREAIFEHCKGISLEDGARWVKERLGIEISSNVLGTWLRKKRADKAIEERLQDIRDDSDRASLVGDIFEDVASLTRANSVMVAQAVFEEFRKPVEERDEKRLIQFMNLALKDRTVGLAHDRFHFVAARRATEFAAELQKINDGEGDEREKIEKAMVLLFGEEPSGFKSAGNANPPTGSASNATQESGATGEEEA